MPGEQRPAAAEPPRGHRLFFALWPPAAIAAALADLALDRVEGRRSRPQTLHLTLAFLGDVGEERIKALEQLADRVAGSAFVWQIDTLGVWGHNRIAWAGGAPPWEMLALVDSLRRALSQAGFPVADTKRPFFPHVTLARRVPPRDTQPVRLPPIAWPCREFVLVHSQLSPQGAAYRVIGRWMLRAVR